MADSAGTPAPCDFFISRAGEDAAVALVIDEILRKAGYTTYIQDRDFGHTSFADRMDDGFSMVEAGARVIAVLSARYQMKPHCQIEARYPLIDDPNNKRQRLIVLRIEECAPQGFLKPIPYVDLVPLLTQPRAFVDAVRGAASRQAPEADFTALHRRAGKQILHDKVWSPVANFTGRDSELAKLEAALWNNSGRAALTDTGGRLAVPHHAQRPDGTGATVAAQGMGGVGKSVLAQHYAWTNTARYHGVWWVRAEKPQDLHDDLAELAARLMGIDPAGMESEQAARLVIDHIGQTRESRPWLIVYDNVETPEAIRGLAPTDNAHVLITTRCANWHGEAEELPIDVFSPDVAVTFLMERANGSERDPEGSARSAAALAEDLGYLPLALAMARAHAWNMHWTFVQYRTHLATMLAREPTGVVDYPQSVFATFTLALDKVLTRAPAAEVLMGLASFLAPERIPLTLFGGQVMSEIELGEAVAALAEGSLITRDRLDDGTPVIGVHRLVQRVMRARLEKKDVLAAGAAQVVEIVAGAFKMPTYAPDVGVAQRLASHAATVLGYAAADDRNAWNLADELGEWLSSRGERVAAFGWYRHALDIAERRASGNPGQPQLQRDVSISLNKIADMLLEEGNRQAALDNYQKALAIAEKLAVDDPGQRLFQRDVAVSFERIADVLREEGDPQAALDNYQKCLAIAEKLAADDPGQPQLHRDVAVSLERIADVLREEGKRKAALVNYQNSLTIKEKLAADDPGQPQLQSDLAVSYAKLAGVGVEPRTNLAKAHAILARLAAQNMLTAQQSGWLGIVEAELAALDGGEQGEPSGPTADTKPNRASPIPAAIGPIIPAGPILPPEPPPPRRSLIDRILGRG